MKKSDGTRDLRLLQNERGYRSALDPLLLAHFVRLHPADRVIDLGTGNGILPVLLAARQECAQIVGIEIQPEMVALARQNVALHTGWREERIQILETDVREAPSVFSRESFDVVVANPPYRKLGDGRLNPDPAKAVARHELTLTLEELATSTRYLLKDKGRMAVVYHPGRLAELLVQLEKQRIRAERLRFVHSTLDGPARMVLLEGRKNGLGKTEVMAPLLIYRRPHVYSSEMEEIFSELWGHAT